MKPDIKNLNIGFAITGSFCTMDATYPAIKKLADTGANVIPIVSYSINTMDTRFQTSDSIKETLKSITGNEIIDTLIDAEPIGAKNLLDLLIVAPCTGNTIARLANAITDTTISMAIKATLRNANPVVLAISTNDALGGNAKNIGLLLNTKNIYFVPFYQDNCIQKPNSLVANNDLIYETVLEALQGKQIQPILYVDTSKCR